LLGRGAGKAGFYHLSFLFGRMLERNGEQSRCLPRHPRLDPADSSRTIRHRELSLD
jgi:hypothetical protein